MAAAEASRRNPAVPVPMAMRGPVPGRAAALHAAFAGVALLSYASRSLFPAAPPPTLLALALSIALPLGLALLIREAVRARAARRGAEPSWQRMFAADWGGYAVAALGMVAALDLYGAAAPGAGLRLAAVALLIGYFAALDLALAGAGGTRPQWGPARVGVLSVGAATACAALMVDDHLARLLARWSQSGGPVDPQRFLVDAAVLSLPPLVLAARAGDSYARGLQARLEQRIALLRAPGAPASTQAAEDDFADVLQRVRDELHEKERVLRALERSVGTEVMRTLLSPGPGDAPRETQMREVVVLFCDLRNFTTFAEYANPEEVLFLLNSYFSRVVGIIGEHGGMVNKFLGDAVLAIFGLADLETAPERAIRAAEAIGAHVEAHRQAGYTRLQTGISIHAGTAAAGRLGSPERYEYSFVGETVNTAMRLDGLTKRLGQHLLISEAVYRRLSATRQRQFRDLGCHCPRGGRDPLRVYAPLDTGME